MTTPIKPHEGGIQYWPTDWTAQCEAKCRKTGEQCPHTCDSQIPSLLAGRAQMDVNWFSIQGRPVNLCRGHYRSWHARAKRLLTLPLIDGGHLSPGNRFAYGSIVIMADRIDFSKDDDQIKVRIPPAWGWVSWRGNVPEGLLDRIPHYVKPDRELKVIGADMPEVFRNYNPDMKQVIADHGRLPTPASPALALIREYLWVGGTWNPELMEHDKVRDMVMLCRDELEKAHAACSAKDWVPGEAMRYDLHSVRGGHVFAWLSSPIPQRQELCCVICKKPKHELFPTIKG